MSAISCFSFYPFVTFFTKKTNSSQPAFGYQAGNFASLAGRISKEEAYTISAHDREVIQHALKNPSQTATELNAITDDAFCKTAAAILESSPNSNKDLQTLLKSLNQEQLLHLAGITSEDLKVNIATQASMKDVALQSVLNTKGKSIWREFGPHAVDFFHHFMTILIGLLNLNEVSPNPVTDSYEARYRLEVYTTIIGYPAVLFGLIYAAVGSVALALPITGAAIIGTVAALIVYLRYFLPPPRFVPGMTNLTRQMVKMDQPPIFPRRELLSQIQNRFEQDKGVLLVGGHGCGKSSLVKAFAQHLTNGEMKDLSDAQVFEGNAAIFGSMMEQGVSLTYLQHMFEGYNKKTIFFLDEIHTLFKNDSVGMHGDRPNLLKTFSDKYPYIIIATTTVEYEKYIKNEENAPFLRRFTDPIFIPAYTSQEMETSLQMRLCHIAPQLFWDDGVLSHIAQRASEFRSNTAQVDAAYSLLALVVKKATIITFPALESELASLQSRIDFLQTELTNQLDVAKGKEYQALLDQRAKKRAEYSAKKNQLELVRKTEAQFLALKERSFQLARKANSDATRREWLLNHIHSRLLRSSVESQRARLGLPARLSKGLVDQTIAEAN